MALVVVALDVREVDRLGCARHLIEIAKIARQVRVVGDALPIALEMADWRLFTTLVRFDAVYVGHFKCNLRRIADMPGLQGYLRELYQVPGVAETVHLTHIKRHYYESHHTINPTRVVPIGPELELEAPHGREKIGGDS